MQPLDVIAERDFAGKLLLDNLPSDQDIFYRVQFLSLDDFTTASEAMTGRFGTAPASKRDVTFVWIR